MERRPATITDLPSEILELIFSHLSPTDFQALLNASPTLRDQVSSKQKTANLCPLVLAILLRHRSTMAILHPDS
ncbi:unnamed protein product [Orchesella dallaii]|uniref:F-box domain-containing protein n=1 Tax=Orchesella dallaii TaxID=48710 RepID=A0ABP1PU98_9HEXA